MIRVLMRSECREVRIRIVTRRRCERAVTDALDLDAIERGADAMLALGENDIARDLHALVAENRALRVRVENLEAELAETREWGEAWQAMHEASELRVENLERERDEQTEIYEGREGHLHDRIDTLIAERENLTAALARLRDLVKAGGYGEDAPEGAQFSRDLYDAIGQADAVLGGVPSSPHATTEYVQVPVPTTAEEAATSPILECQECGALAYAATGRGWYFTTETGWLCPDDASNGRAQSGVSVENREDTT